MSDLIKTTQEIISFEGSLFNKYKNTSKDKNWKNYSDKEWVDKEKLDVQKKLLINDFNDFIEKWCGDASCHLIDSDENDGEELRQKIKLLGIDRK